VQTDRSDRSVWNYKIGISVIYFQETGVDRDIGTSSR